MTLTPVTRCVWVCACADIIFFVYLYQRWLYPVDASRRNEFGSAADDDAAVAAQHSDEAPSQLTQPPVQPQSSGNTATRKRVMRGKRR